MLALLLIAYGTSDNAGVQERAVTVAFENGSQRVLSPQLIDLANSSRAGV